MQTVVRRPPDAADEAVRKERGDVWALRLDRRLPRRCRRQLETDRGGLEFRDDGLAVGDTAVGDAQRHAERRRAAQRHLDRLAGERRDPAADVAAVRRLLRAAVDRVDHELGHDGHSLQPVEFSIERRKPPG